MRIRHGRISLELHELTRAEGPALLLLHALYASSAAWGEAPAAWPGRVYALDFCGHGRSDRLAGGGYQAELLAADADAALAHVGSAAIAGAGIGAYVALLLAGARKDLVPAALLLPGAGLAGAGPVPNSPAPRRSFDQPEPDEPETGDYDPMVRALDRDVRPTDYAEPFARSAHKLLFAENGQDRPPWWKACRRSPVVQSVPVELPLALARLAAAVGKQR